MNTLMLSWRDSIVDKTLLRLLSHHPLLKQPDVFTAGGVETSGCFNNGPLLNSLDNVLSMIITQ